MSVGKLCIDLPLLGQIPKHWRIERLRRYLHGIEQGWSPEAENREPSSDEWGVLKLNSVSHGCFYPAAAKALPYGVTPEEKLEICEGDFLITRANTPLLVGDVCFVKSTRRWLMLCDLIYRLRLDLGEIDAPYLSYYLASQVGRCQIEAAARGSNSSMVKISQEHIRGWWVIVPPLDEQRSIATFLDRELALIDSLIAAKGVLIELLGEKRRVFITCAVTKGLDTSVCLRDSGIYWLGKIPAHWKTRRLAWLFRERDERSEPDLPLLEVSIDAGVVIREFSSGRIENTASDFNAYKVARAGDIAFNKMRMWQGAVGVAPEDGLVSPDYTVAFPNGSLEPDYAGYLFRTDIFSAECARRSHGIVWDRLRLYWEGFRDIEVPLPSREEQSAIVARITAETKKLDNLAQATERTITLLKERRAALITASVTGAIEVRELA